MSKIYLTSKTLLGGVPDVNRRFISEMEANPDGKPDFLTEVEVCIINRDMKPWSDDNQRHLNIILKALREAANEPAAAGGGVMSTHTIKPTILFLCKDEMHARKACEALGVEHGMYLPWQSALTGSRFRMVVWLAGEVDEMEDTFLRERAPTLLELGGKLIVL